MVRSRHTPRIHLIKVLGLIGYMIWAWQWLWVAFLYVRGFFESRVGKWFFPAGQADMPSAPQTGPIEFSPIVLKAGVALVVMLLVVFVAMAARLYTRGVEKTAATVVRQSAAKITPVVVRHRHHRVTKAEARQINEQVLRWVKIVLSLLPLLVVAAAPGSDPLVPRGAALLIAAFLALLSVCIFLLHALLSAGRHGAGKRG